MLKERLDHYLAKKYPGISRGFLQKLIATEQVLVNGQVQKSGYKLSGDDEVKILYDLEQIGQIPPIELPIIYEDDNVLVVNKPAGVLSHALTKFHSEPSVASFLRQRLTRQPEYDTRFGIVHRLDRATSGIMVCAKDYSTLSFLQKQFADKTVKKTYQAVVTGKLTPPAAIIDLPLERNPKKPATYKVGPGGKSAQTVYKTTKTNNTHSLLTLEPQTGRTHQLRVHLAHVGHPIVGDVLYGGEEAPGLAGRLYLHAGELSLTMPNGQRKSFGAPGPGEFAKILGNK